jgi:spore maturation protein CgeB
MAYPFAIASYFRHALEKRPDVELVTAGAFTGQQIPWGGGMTIPRKYLNQVNYPIPPSITRPSWKVLKNKIGQDFDAIINVDAGFHLADKPDIPYAVVATDPHVLQIWYDSVRPLADYFFNMQENYMKPGDVLLPYACSPDHHYAMSDVEAEYDASLIGLHYENRTRLAQTLVRNQIKVLYDLGLIYDEYREANNKSFIGLNWSSLQDINARTFEMMAMKQVPVINRLPNLDHLGFIEDQHYLGFDSIEEAVSKVKWALSHEDAAKAIALSAHNLVHEQHTYEKRVDEIISRIL